MKKLSAFLFAILFVSLACSAISPRVIVVTATPLSGVNENTVCLTTTEYENEVVKLSSTYIPIIKDFTNMLSQAQGNRSLLSDSFWQTQVETDLTKIDQFAYAAQALKPPEGLKSSDDQLKLASIELLAATSDVRDGIHNLNSTSFSNASTHMFNFTNYINKATKEVQASTRNDACP